ncbi:MAG TPA: pitrilysin family protein [Gammaproteobacteria bacterium]
MTGIIPYPAHVDVLGNGLKVIVMPMPSNGLVAYWTIVRTGSRDEYEKGRTGFAHFFEHMMFRGTERYPSERYQRILTEIGADANAYTTDDLTAYHVSLAAEDLETVIELESDRFRNLAYSRRDFETEAGAVYGEYRKSRTDPLFTLYEAVVETAFDVHPYGHTTMGYEADIAAMPSLYDYSREFFARYYRPDNTLLFVAGEVEPARVFDEVARKYADWAPGYAPPPIPDEPEQRAERRIDVDYDGRTLPVVWLAYKIDAFDTGNPLRVAADLLAELAFGETSDAYRRLVLDEQVVEFLAAGAEWNRDPGLLDVYARVKDPSQVDYVLGVLDETATRFRAVPPELDALAALKSRIRYDFLMGFETADRAAERVARPLAISAGLGGLEALHTAYAGVAPDDVQAAADAYLRPERRTVGVLRGAR